MPCAYLAQHVRCSRTGSSLRMESLDRRLVFMFALRPGVMIINNCLASPTASRADCQLRAADTIKALRAQRLRVASLPPPTPLHSPAGLPNFFGALPPVGVPPAPPNFAVRFVIQQFQCWGGGSSGPIMVDRAAAGTAGVCLLRHRAQM